MAIETLYADAHIAGDFSNPGNAVGNTPSTWAGVVNTNSNYTSRWSMANPSSPLTSGATQTIRVTARKGTNTNNPGVTINVYENGVEVSGLGSLVPVTSTTGQVIEKTFDSSIISNGANVEVEVVQSGQGGSGSARNSAQISHIEWTADVTPVVAPTQAPVLSSTGATENSVSLSATAVADADTYEFQRANGFDVNGNPISWVTVQNTSSRTVTVGGLVPSTEYYFRVRGVGAGGPGPYSSSLLVTTLENISASISFDMTTDILIDYQKEEVFEPTPTDLQATMAGPAIRTTWQGSSPSYRVRREEWSGAGVPPEVTV